MSWYALYTRPRHEKKAFDDLMEKSIESFLPMARELRQWKDRRKWIEVPLFSSYVLVNIELKNRLYALQTNGIVRMVSFGGQPARIPDWQIEQLKQVLSNVDTLQPEKYLKVGDLVKVIQGPLKDVRGYLQEIRGETRVSILIDGIYQSASFVIDRQWVRKLEDEVVV